MLSTYLLLLLAAGSSARFFTAGDEAFLSVNEEEDDFDNFVDFDDLTDTNYGEDNPDFDNGRTLTVAQDRIGFYEMANFSDFPLYVNAYKADWMNFYWWGGRIPIKFSREITKKQRKEIAKTLKFLMKNTCLKFGLAKGDKYKSYLNFENKDGSCHTNPGKYSPTHVNLGSGSCQNAGRLMLHEILHGLGFRHTMTRPDRDDYITMHMENLGDLSKKSQYQKFSEQYSIEEYGVTHGLPYECHSIMHYQDWLNSKGNTKMFEAKHPETCQFPDRYRGHYEYPDYSMTANDMAAVNKVYCPDGRKKLGWRDWWDPTVEEKKCKNKKDDLFGVPIGAVIDCNEMKNACSQSNWFREMSLYCPGTCMCAAKTAACKSKDLDEETVKSCSEEDCNC